MFKNVKEFGLLIMVIVCLVTSSGCVAVIAGAAAGVGGYAWVKGALVKEFDVSSDKLHDASLKAFKKLEIPVDVDKSDRLTATIRGEFADGRDVKIDIDALTERSAKIKIRVGLFGDRTKSEMIYNTIQSYL